MFYEIGKIFIKRENKVKKNNENHLIILTIATPKQPMFTFTHTVGF